MSVCYYDFDTYKVVPKDAVVLTKDDLRDWAADPDELRGYAKGLESATWYSAATLLKKIAHQLKPARIPEPGLYGVVRAWDGTRYVRDQLGVKRGWRHLGDGGSRLTWDEIDNPELIREGV